MNCVKCCASIPEARLKAIPTTKTCVKCSSVQAVAGFNVVTGKNEYAQLQIMDRESAERMHFLASRSSFGVSRGVKFRFDSRKN